MPRKRKKAGTTFVKTISRGPNKGDRVRFRVAKGGKPYPVRVLADKGGDSTLRDNAGVSFGKQKKLITKPAKKTSRRRKAPR